MHLHRSFYVVMEKGELKKETKKETTEAQNLEKDALSRLTALQSKFPVNTIIGWANQVSC